MQEHELLDELGRGGMDRVQRARHKASGRIVAIMSLHPHLDDREEAQRRFERDGRA